MHWTKPNGDAMTYADATPVPRRTYRCKASCGVRSEHDNKIIRKHPCKLVTDHDGDHKCICSRTWGRTEA